MVRLSNLDGHWEEITLISSLCFSVADYFYLVAKFFIFVGEFSYGGGVFGIWGSNLSLLWLSLNWGDRFAERRESSCLIETETFIVGPFSLISGLRSLWKGDESSKVGRVYSVELDLFVWEGILLQLGALLNLEVELFIPGVFNLFVG